MKKTILIMLTTALVFANCDNGNNTETHTHTWETAWTTNATHHWHECTAHDGAKDGEAPHEWEWQETAPATQTAEGLETETCTICGTTRGTRPIDKLPEPPQFKEATINLFGNTKTATVQATLLEAEWSGTPAKIETIINNAYSTAGGAVQVRFEEVFTRSGVIITVEKTTEYANYKVIGDGVSLFLNFATLDDLQSGQPTPRITLAIAKMAFNQTDME